MSEGPSWDPYFERVNQQIPGGTQNTKKRLTEREILERQAEINRGNYANVAAAMGGVVGEDDDPLVVINEQYNTGGQSTADLKRETDSIAAGLAQLQADVKANNNSGKSFVVAVADYGTSVPSVFDKFADLGSGAVYNDGNTLQMNNADGRELFIYDVEELATDYPEVSLIVPTQARVSLSSYINRALFFIIRANLARDNYVFGRLNGNRLRVGAVVDGVSTLDSPVWFTTVGDSNTEVTVPLGVYYTLAGGTVAGEEFFPFKVNNQLRATFEDTTGASLFGADYRWTGFGIRNDDDPFLGERGPSVSHFMANDNAPAEVVGSVATMVRLSTTRVTMSAGSNPMPTNFWGTVSEISADFLPGLDVPNGTVTIPESRRYTITAGMRCGTSWPNHFRWDVYRNGNAHQRFGNDMMYGNNALGGTIIPDGVGASWTGYLYEGDVVGLGTWTDGLGVPSAMRGEATGNQTYWTIGAA